MVLGRGYWITVIALYTVTFLIVFSWAASSYLLMLWLVPLILSGYIIWRYRADERIARFANVVPLAILIATGFMGRWPWR